jgi:hypothetical protein
VPATTTKGGAVKLRRTQRNLVERETARQRAIEDELRRHDPLGQPDLVFAHEAVLIRLYAAR